MRSHFDLVEKPIISREERLKKLKRLKRWREN
jgi:hypothetical protein